MAHVLGVRGWFVGGLALDTLTTPDLRDWPSDGVLVLMLYLSDGGRQVMMGNDTYFYAPSTGAYGHNNDTPESVRARYGPDAIVLRGMWASPEEFARVVAEAMAAEVWP
jgi:hypothetical protein